MSTQEARMPHVALRDRWLEDRLNVLCVMDSVYNFGLAHTSFLVPHLSFPFVFHTSRALRLYLTICAISPRS